MGIPSRPCRSYAKIKARTIIRDAIAYIVSATSTLTSTIILFLIEHLV